MVLNSQKNIKLCRVIRPILLLFFRPLQHILFMNLVSMQWVRHSSPLSLSCTWWSTLWSLWSATSDAPLLSMKIVLWDEHYPNFSPDHVGLFYLFIYCLNVIFLFIVIWVSLYFWQHIPVLRKLWINCECLLISN